jgi:hypothetical protein
MSNPPSFRTTCRTARLLVSYANRVTRPARSDRKYTVSPTHIGARSFEPSRGTLVTLESRRSAIQIGVVCPPR